MPRSQPSPTPSTPAVAAIVYQQHGQADALLQVLVAALQADGRRVLGLVQAPPDSDPQACATDMKLIDIASSQRFGISQALGSGAQGCCLDPQGVAQASQILARLLAPLQAPPELVLINRFGKLEACGGGFHAEFLSLIEADIPVLTAVREDHLQAWRRFTGDLAHELPPRLDVVLQWCHDLPSEAQNSS